MVGRAAAAGAGQWWVVWCWGVTEVWGHPWPCYCPLPPTLLLPPPPVTLLLPPPYLILLLPRHGDQGVQHCYCPLLTCPCYCPCCCPGMGIKEFSTAHQWAPYAKDTLSRVGGRGRKGLRHFLFGPLQVRVGVH